MTDDAPRPKTRWVSLEELHARAAAAGWPRTTTPLGWTVTVRCEAPAHPSDARPIVMVARCVSDGMGQPPWSFELRGRSEWAALDRGRGTEGARVIDVGDWSETPERMAYRLRCSTCPETLPIGDEFLLYDRMNERAAARKRSDTLQRIRASRSYARASMR